MFTTIPSHRANVVRRNCGTEQCTEYLRRQHHGRNAWRHFVILDIQGARALSKSEPNTVLMPIGLHVSSLVKIETHNIFLRPADGGQASQRQGFNLQNESLGFVSFRGGGKKSVNQRSFQGDAI